MDVCHSGDNGSERTYLVIVHKSVANPHERNEEEVYLADHPTLNRFVPCLSIVRDDGGSNVFGV